MDIHQPAPLDDLTRVALDLAPCSTLLVAPAAHPLYERLAGQTELIHRKPGELLDDWQDMPRQRLALLIDSMDSLPPRQMEILIARLRDQLCETLYCVADSLTWPAERMLALGLRPLGHYPQAGLPALYHFDLYDYKRTPEWLNARHWAHPELWDKFRW